MVNNLSSTYYLIDLTTILTRFLKYSLCHQKVLSQVCVDNLVKAGLQIFLGQNSKCQPKKASYYMGRDFQKSVGSLELTVSQRLFPECPGCTPDVQVFVHF